MEGYHVDTFLVKLLTGAHIFGQTPDRSSCAGGKELLSRRNRSSGAPDQETRSSCPDSSGVPGQEFRRSGETFRRLQETSGGNQETFLKKFS